MKTKIYLSCIVVILFLSSCKTLSISNDQPLDYIVLISGDTLSGKMEYFKQTATGPEYYKKVRLKDTNGKKKKFRWEEIDSYGFNGADYVSFKLTRRKQSFEKGSGKEIRYYLDPYGERRFLKVKHIGQLSHYQFEWIDLGYDAEDYNDQPSWVTQDLIKKEGINYFLNAEGSALFGIPRKSLSNYLSDCAKIQEKITEKDLNYAFEIVDFYNENCGRE